MLFIGDGQSKMDALLKKQVRVSVHVHGLTLNITLQRAARLQKLTDEERQKLGLPARGVQLTPEALAKLPPDYADAL